MLYDKQSIPELNLFYHRNDDVNKKYMDYEKVILDKSISPFIYNNSTMSKFLTMLNGLVSLFFDQFNIVKNMKNFTVDKYFYKHTS